jgi:hypothetical protein
VDDHARRAASLADCEGCDNDVGESAIILQRRGMRTSATFLPFHSADAAKKVAAVIRQSEIGGDPCGKEYGEPQEPAVGLDCERLTDGGKGERD